MGILSSFLHRKKGHFDHRPIFFVVGTGRCGSTLLARILASHPEVEVFPGEGNSLWHPDLYPYKERKYDVPPFWVDPKGFSELSLKSWDRVHRKKILRTVDRTFASSPSKKAHVVKSAMIAFMLPSILELFPNARFIHIHRKGLSVLRSFYKKEAEKYPDRDEESFKKGLAAYWNSSVSTIQDAPRSIEGLGEGSFFQLSYEDLCRQPEEELHKLFAFMDLSSNGHTYDLSELKESKGQAPNEFEMNELLPRMEEGYQRLAY